MAAHGDMLKLLSNQQMDIALQKFETEVAPRLQDISVAAKHMIENQSKDLERMSRRHERAESDDERDHDRAGRARPTRRGCGFVHSS